MKTHKVISKTIHQHILSLRHEYLLRATCLSPKQCASLGELSFPWGNQPPLKISQIFQGFKNFLRRKLCFHRRIMHLYHTSGFRTETMYDYYIVMKSMFLVVKLSFHPIIGYASLIILFP
jgi:hypothetical protein